MVNKTIIQTATCPFCGHEQAIVIPTNGDYRCVGCKRRVEEDQYQLSEYIQQAPSKDAWTGVLERIGVLENSVTELQNAVGDLSSICVVAHEYIRAIDGGFETLAAERMAELRDMLDRPHSPVGEAVSVDGPSVTTQDTVAPPGSSPVTARKVGAGWQLGQPATAGSRRAMNFDCPHGIDTRRERCLHCVPDLGTFASPGADRRERIATALLVAGRGNVIECVEAADCLDRELSKPTSLR